MISRITLVSRIANRFISMASYSSLTQQRCAFSSMNPNTKYISEYFNTRTYRLGLRSSPGFVWRHSMQLDRAASTSTQAYQYEPVSTNSMNYQDAIIEEVDFDPSLTNSITLMGNVGRKPEIKFLENGNKVTSWSLAYSSRKDADTEWFDIEAWGPLAERVYNEIDKGQKISVQGRIRTRTWTDNQGTQRKSIKITANTIKRIRPMPMNDYNNTTSTTAADMQQQQQGMNNNDTPPPMMQQSPSPSFPSKPYQPSNTTTTSSSPSSSNAIVTTEELWISFFEDRSNWYDNRPRKNSGEMKSNAPDFKRKDGGRDAPALWISGRSTPAWVMGELQKVDAMDKMKEQQDVPPF